MPHLRPAASAPYTVTPIPQPFQVDHSYVWHPEADTDPIAQALGVRGLSLPHLLLDADTSGGGIRGVLDARTLVLGILTAPELWPNYVSGPRLADKDLRTILRLCATDLRFANEDKAAARAGSYLFDTVNEELAFRAWHRAARIIPDGVRIRANLIAIQFLAAGRSDRERVERLNDVTVHFPVWRRLDTTTCVNEDWAWYAGLAALTFLGRMEERDALLPEIPARVISSPRVGRRFDQLRTARPWHIDEVKFE